MAVATGLAATSPVAGVTTVEPPPGVVTVPVVPVEVPPPVEPEPPPVEPPPPPPLDSSSGVGAGAPPTTIGFVTVTVLPPTSVAVRRDFVGPAVLVGVKDARRAGTQPRGGTHFRAGREAGDGGSAVAEVPGEGGVVGRGGFARELARGAESDVGLHAVEADDLSARDVFGRGEFRVERDVVQAGDARVVQLERGQVEAVVQVVVIALRSSG